MSTGDYAKATWLPSPNCWTGNQGMEWVVIHATASGGVQTAMQLATSSEFTDRQSKSVHYINDRDTAQIIQIVSEADSAWGNCCVDSTSLWPSTPNWNVKTISIENVKYSSDNSEALTSWQYQNLLLLVRDICQRHAIPLVHGTPTQPGIIFHHDLMPQTKAGCPGTFPYATFFSDLQQGAPVLPVKKNSQGCTYDTILWYQLAEGEMDLCGIASVVSLLAAGPAGTGPALNKATGKPWTAEDIDVRVDAESAAMGYPDPKTFPGVSVADMTRIFKDEGLHFQQITPTWPAIEAASAAGYPVVITAFEPALHAWSPKAGTWVPAYPWGPTTPANHVFPIGGFDHNHNPICYDPLNNSFQGYWPPTYQASAFTPSYAAVVQLPFLSPIPSSTPLSWPQGFNAQQGVSMPIPTGWKDDGTTLTAPNGIPVVHGFRQYIMSAYAWNDLPLEPESGHSPLEESNPTLGSGTRQTFHGHILEYTANRGVFEGYAPQELFAVRADRDAKAVALASALAHVAALEAQLAAIVPPPDFSKLKASLVAVGVSLAAAMEQLP